MASSFIFPTLILAITTILIHSASAKKFIVGDHKGWTTKVDYEAWASDKDFRVGDQLIFKYAQGAHNVFRVDQSSFQQCVPPPINEAFTSGNDIITLETPGRKWYICGLSNHCEDGKQKLDITVLPESLSPSPTQPQSGGPSSSSIVYHVSVSLVTITLGLQIY